MGFFSSLFKRKSAIQLAYENTSVIGEQRHKNNRYIIENYRYSEEPLDILAVAFSYEREGAAYRKTAISFFEKFLENPTVIPILPNTYLEGHNPRHLFSYWVIYSDLAILYEKEYDFDKAIYYLKKLPKESNYSNPADYTRIGDVYAKIDINQSVKYYEQLKLNKSVYSRHKDYIDSAYQEALKKQSSGYKYKPRKRSS